MTEKEDLCRRIADLIIEACNIPDAPDEVPIDAPLIGPDSPLGLDSLDAVEIVVAIQREFDVRIGGEEGSREVLQTLATVAEFVLRERA